MTSVEKLSRAIKDKAMALGFSNVGIAKADALTDDRQYLSDWLDNGYHGKMQYMANHFDKRLDPRKLMEGAQSVIVVSHNYFPEKILTYDGYKIARYAYGEDYHKVLKDKLKLLLRFIEDQAGAVRARVFTDSAPVMERQWAIKAGLGWQGKNTLLIQKTSGSYHFLAEIIIDLPLAYDPAFRTDHCGTCTRCIDACPTQALLPNKTLDASRCISYLTIELKDDIPESFKNQWQDWIFGCDICQEVCPWNAKASPHDEPRFRPLNQSTPLNNNDWETIEEETFNKIFTKSAINRAQLSKLKKTIDFLNR